MRKQQGTRFFVGLHETGDNTLRLSQGLRVLGGVVTNVVSKRSAPILQREEQHDGYIRGSQRKYAHRFFLLYEFFKQCFRNDVFVFNSSRSFTGQIPDRWPWKWLRHLAYMDLATLRALGKKTVVVVCGSDLRSRRLLIEEMKQAGLKEHVKYTLAEMGTGNALSDRIKEKKAKKIEQYATHIFARPNSAQFLTRKYHLLWLPVNLERFEYAVEETECPLVIHAPSNTKIKGTKYVLKAVEELNKEGYKFDFELCQEMVNQKVRRLLTNAHIAIDQLILPGYGLFALEAMASGCAVLGSAVPAYNGNPIELPIMTTTPDTIYQNLKLLLEDQRLRTKMAREGRKYVERYHDHVKVARDFLEKIGELPRS